ncbi:hypothetical protein T069G_10025 [Trichoderma breve]|uniref:Uncharacterized protein n=1 Tax=Trichoderma breve TaxID=2034170 RepID=A0A9W9E4U1_9HYPO|nr:hypothetical protein T069G_10025 [Trichoderma breve]KAJ4856657.1 hypothetical protein T069G_10025 [Trichoderma breve]
MPSPWRQSTWWSESRSFYKLLLNFGSSEATDPRDLVYALRGMSSDLANKCDDPLFPDYKKSQEKLVHDVIKYIYDFDMSDFNVAPRLSSIRELATYLPKLETDIFRHLTEMSRSDHMERILRTPEILVSQDMIKAAAQYDKDAANLNAAKEVFEAFWSHQNQIAITENVILATLKNSESGHSAMCFLLSLKTQDYRVAPILEAIPRIASKDSRRKIIRMLGQKNYSNDTIPEVLTAAAEIQDSDLQAEFIKTLLQQTDFRNDTTQRVLTAAAKIQDFDLQTEIIKTFLQQTDFSNDTIQQVLTAAFKVQDFDLQTEIIKTFLQRTDFRNDTVLDVLAKDCWDDTIPDILDTVAETQNYDLRTYFIKRLLQKKGSSNNITSEIITAAAQIRDENLLPEIVRILVEQKGTSNDTIFELFAAGSTAELSKFELFVIEKEFFKAKEIEEEILQEKRRQIRKVHAKLY